MRKPMQLPISIWWAIPLLASLLAVFSRTLFFSPALAAACNPGVALDASGGSAICDMGIFAQVNAGVLTLAADANATVPGSPFTLTGSPVVANFFYSSLVKDHRGSTNGWKLQAASPTNGIINSSAGYPLDLTSLDPSSTCTNGTCTPVTFTSVTPLTTSAQTYLQAGNAGHTIVVDGDYTDKINGSFTIPSGAPSGVYRNHHAYPAQHVLARGFTLCERRKGSGPPFPC